MSGSGIPTIPRPICCPGSTRSCIWPARRLPGGSPRRTRAAIRDSRIGPTRRLAEVAAGGRRPGLFVSASAIGIYGFDRGDAVLCEESVRGEGFLADVVADWEAATAPAAEAGPAGRQRAHRNRAVRPRRHVASTASAVRRGTGRPRRQRQQWLSWIGIDDLLDVYYRALYDARLSGPVNAVAPSRCAMPITPALAGVLHRPALLPVPSLGPRLLLGQQGSRELAEANQRVAPTKPDAGPPVPAPARRRRARSRTRARLTDDVGHEAAHQIAHSRDALWASSVVRERNSSWREPEADDSPSRSSASHTSSSRASTSGWNCSASARPSTNAWDASAVRATSVAPGGSVHRSKCHWNQVRRGSDRVCRS